MSQSQYDKNIESINEIKIQTKKGILTNRFMTNIMNQLTTLTILEKIFHFQQGRYFAGNER